jgi:hypothetical protein
MCGMMLHIEDITCQTIDFIHLMTFFVVVAKVYSKFVMTFYKILYKTQPSTEIVEKFVIICHVNLYVVLNNNVKTNNFNEIKQNDSFHKFISP